MHMKNLKGQWGVRARVASWVAMAGLVSSALLPGAALAAAGDVTYSNDTTITLGSITFLILAGSTASSVITGDSTLTVDVDSGDTLTLEMTSGNNPVNDKSLRCSLVGGKPRLIITGDHTVIVTPTTATTVCSYNSGGGGGGGSSSVAVTTTACSLSAPNGGGSLTGGTTTNITWTSAGTGITDVNLYYSVDGGVNYGLIVAGSPNDGSQSWIVPNTATAKARVKVECRDSGGGSTTAMKDASDSDFTIALASALPVVAAPTPVTTTTSAALPRATANAALPTAYPVDTLIKSTDPAVSTVYYIGLDAKRHPYPSEAIFKTWFPDFSGVKSINPTTLASISLGKPQLVRPGTHWVKIQSDPKTYLVEPGGYSLRWIKDEATAKTLGGTDWNKNIIDIEPTYFTKFSVGAEIGSTDLATTWPAGSLVKGSDGKVWYITSTGRREMTVAGQTGNKVQARFIETSTAAGWQAKAVESQVTVFEDALFSLQSF